MNDSTATSIVGLTFLKQMDPVVYERYLNLAKHSPDFQSHFIHSVAGLSAKIKKIADKNKEASHYLNNLKKTREDAEEYYQTMMDRSKNMQPLSLEINSNPELKQAFNRIVEQTAPQIFDQKENVHSLLKKNHNADEQLYKLQNEQIRYIVSCLSDVQSVYQKFLKIIRELSTKFPWRKEELYSQDLKKFMSTLSENIVFEMIRVFHKSAKETPTGYHYISLHDFFNEGMKQFLSVFETDRMDVIQFTIQDSVHYLYQKLLDFYHRFKGGKEKIETVIEQHQTHDALLIKQLEQLEHATKDYLACLGRLSMPEVREYDDRSRMPKKDLGVPDLNPFKNP